MKIIINRTVNVLSLQLWLFYIYFNIYNIAKNFYEMFYIKGIFELFYKIKLKKNNKLYIIFYFIFN